MKNYKPKKRLNASEYIKGILSGDRVILSRAITVIESNLENDKILSKKIIQEILPKSGNSIRIGITGVPGVGKSTFIEVFGKYLIEQGHKVAVLSIDPSSQRSKGSILGDKTRMEELANLENAYIRPSASGDTLGGVANKTGETMLLCEAAGYDVILIETVGVGQSETAVHGMTDFFLLLMLSGAGDELQGIKRGIMEMADLIVINKADGDNVKKTELSKREFENALHLFPGLPNGWTPKVLTASALYSKGLIDIWTTIEEFITLTKGNGFFKKHRNEQSLGILKEGIEQGLTSGFFRSKAIKPLIEQYEQQILNAEINPYEAAQLLLSEYFEELKKRK